MRVSPRQGEAEVTTICSTPRGPIRMHIAGVTYRMDADEALQLANSLADAVSDLKAGITTHKGE